MAGLDFSAGGDLQPTNTGAPGQITETKLADPNAKPLDFSSGGELVSKPSAGSYVKEAAKGLVAGPLNFAGSIAKGVGALGAGNDPEKLKIIDAAVSQIKDSPSAQDANDFLNSLRETYNIDPMTASLYKAAGVAKWQGDEAKANDYLDQARNWSKNTLKAGQDLQDGSKQGALAPAPGWENSWTRDISEGLGTVVASLPVGGSALTAGKFATRFIFGAEGALGGVGSQYDRGQQDLAKARAGQEPNSPFNQMTDDQAQQVIANSSKWGAVVGAAQIVPMEAALTRGFANVPVMQKVLGTALGNKLTGVAARVLTQAAAFGGISYGQQVGNNLITKLSANPDQPLTEDAFNQALSGALTGATMGAGHEAVHGTGQGINYLRGNKQPPIDQGAPPGGNPPPPPPGGPTGPSGPSGPTAPPQPDTAPSASPAAGAGPSAPDQVPQGVASVNLLRAAGWLPQQIQDMNPAERVQHLKEAIELGVKPLPSTAPPVGTAPKTALDPSTSDAQATQVNAAGPGFTEFTDSNGNLVHREGSAAWRNNNPGNIEYGNFAKSHGAVGNDGHFAVFPDYATGRSAKESLLFESPAYSSLTLGEAISKWAPSSENNTGAYINAVSKATGLPADTPLKQMNPQQRNAVMDAMQTHEGFKAGTETINGKPSAPSTNADMSPNVDLGPPQPAQKEAPAGTAPKVESLAEAAPSAWSKLGEKPAADTSAQSQTTASVPFMITNAQRQELASRGYSPDQIANMKPADAQNFLKQPASPAPDQTEQTTSVGAKPNSVSSDIAPEGKNGELVAKTWGDASKQLGLPPDTTYSEFIQAARDAGHTAVRFTEGKGNRYEDISSLKPTADVTNKPAKVDNTPVDKPLSDSIKPNVGEQKAKQANPSRPMNVMEFMASKGGLRDEGGELSHRDITVRNSMTRFGPVLRAKGLHPDAMREALVEAGYMHDQGEHTGGMATTDASHVYDLIDRHLSGEAVVPHGEEQRQAEFDEKRKGKLQDFELEKYGKDAPIAKEYGPKLATAAIKMRDEHGLQWTDGDLKFAHDLMTRLPDVHPDDAIAEAVYDRQYEQEKAAAEHDKAVKDASFEAPWDEADKERINAKVDERNKLAEQDAARAQAAERGNASSGERPAEKQPAERKSPDQVAGGKEKERREQKPAEDSNVRQQSDGQSGRQQQRELNQEKPASWVVKEKATGKVMFETFDKAKVDALNTSKYEAVPIKEHLVGLNKSSETAAKINKPSDYGAKNTFVTKDKAQALRDLISGKLRSQMSSGIDPELVSAGTQLAAFHIEAGARKFGDFVKAMSEHLGVAAKDLRLYLRSWYNGARDMMEDAGHDVSDMDTPEAVKAAMKDINNVSSGQQVLERDSSTAAAGDRMGKADVPAATRGNEPGTEQGGETVHVPDTGPNRGDSIPENYAPVVGEDGHPELPQRPPEPPLGDPTPGDIERSAPHSESGLPPDREPVEKAQRLAAEAASLETRRKAQAEAERITPVHGDLKSIADTLPMLFPEQHVDVHKTEQRFAEPNGHGMMLTNGTGTGKTFSGLGVIKRLERFGKRNVLVVAPTDGILKQWITAAKEFGMNMRMLGDTKDKGGGLSATTYANLGMNDHLADTNWHAVVPDESHNLSSAADGKPTKALDTFRALTLHPEGFSRRADMVLRDDLARIEAMPKDSEERSNAFRRFLEKSKALQEGWREQERPKALFMSATPFAYHFSLDYGHGYMFDFPKVDNTRGGYNRGDGRDLFYMQNFGYRMKYNKLTKPDASVKGEIMERQFHENLKKTGALAGRALEVDKDYDRKFVLVHDAVGKQIDDGLKALSANPQYRAIADYVHKKFDYLSRQQLLEAIKAQASIPYIQKSLDMGRKVVVFHDFNVGGGFSPFHYEVPTDHVTNFVDKDGQHQEIKTEDAYAQFLRENPYVQKMNFSKYRPPVEALSKAFPDAMIYNGTVSKGQREAAQKAFNDDNSGKNLIVVQSAAGQAGISLHDTTGEHARVSVNLGMPGRPTTALQEEGRIYRVGQQSDAMFRYLSTGTNWERWAFASKIAERAGTAENLAMGNQARTMRQAFVDAYTDAGDYPPQEGEGKGGKEADKAMNNVTSEFDAAKSHYFAQQKKQAGRANREGVDYYATPEPVGLKMVEFADIKPGEKVLEPSAGHGAISRFFPEDSAKTLVEPSDDLASRAALSAPGARVINDRFENLDKVNKFDAIVMNPPFGSGGKTAMEHLEKAVDHLRNGGRIVALIPRGGMADKRFDSFMEQASERGMHLVADTHMPSVTFQRAGTSVNSRIVTLEKQTDPGVASQVASTKYRDYTNAETIGELFDRMENASMPDRLQPTNPEPMDAEEEKATQVARANNAQESGINNAKRAGVHEFTTADVKHTKTGEPVFVATIKDRVDRDAYNNVNAVAKENGGYYSSFRGAGAVPGFLFKTAEARAKFMDSFKPQAERPQAPLASFARPQETFYSGMIRATEGLHLNKGTPEQWLNTIKNAQGVKPEEMKWTGIEDWLKAQAGHVTKAQVLDFMREHQVQVHEVVKGGGSGAEPLNVREMERLQELRSIAGDMTDAERQEFRALAVRNNGGEMSDHSETKFSSYQLPGGENYREMLLTLPERKPQSFADWQSAMDKKYGERANVLMTPEEQAQGTQLRGNYQTDRAPSFRGGHFDEPNVLAHVRFNDRTTEAAPTPEQQANIARKAEIEAQAAKLQKHIANLSAMGGKEAEIAMRPQADELRALWKAGEISAGELSRRSDKLWADNMEQRRGTPAFGNMLKLQREHDALMNEAKALDLPKKEKTLFLEELQSDWHQKGRKQGYGGPEAKAAAEIEKQRVVSLGNNLKPLLKAEDYLGFDTAADALAAIRTHDNWASRWDVRNNRELVAAGDAYSYAHSEYVRKFQAAQSGVPDAPFKTSWHELAMKRMIRHAAENGYDRIAWTPGEVQNERYDLSKQVKMIGYEKNADGTYMVNAVTNDNYGHLLGDGKLTEAQLEEHVGKDVAKKIANGEGAKENWAANNEPRSEKRVLRGVDLKVGGQGQRGFYDKILPDTANKLGKKFGVKVEKTEIPTGIKAADRFEVVDGDGDGVETFATRAEAENRAADGGLSVKELPVGGKTVHSMPITPEMRDSVMQGQPLFSHAPARAVSDFVAGKSFAEREQLNKDVVAVGQKILGTRIRVGVIDRLDHNRFTQGNFDPDTRRVLVAMEAAANPYETMGHEAVHGLRDIGAITKPEWETLKDAAGKYTLDDGKSLLDYTRQTYEDHYRKLFDVTPANLEDMIHEEAVAQMFGLHVADKLASPVGSRVTRILQKLQQFIEGVRNVMKGNGFHSASGVMDNMMAGKFAQRAAGQGTGRGYRLNARDPSLSSMFPTEKGADDKEQALIPGTDKKMTEAEMLQKRADARLRPTVAQKPMEEGLFGDSKDQGSLFSIARPDRNPRAGTFEAPHDEKIKDILSDSTDTLLGRGQRATSALHDTYRRHFNDVHYDLNRAQQGIKEAGRSLPETQDAYNHAQLARNITSHKLTEFDNNTVKPLMADMHRSGVSMQELDQFLKARHAVERNIEIGQRYEPTHDFHKAMTNPDAVGASGLSENQANDILNKFDHAGKYKVLEALGDRVTQMNRDTRAILLGSGDISQAQHDAMAHQYKNYVPLRGFDDVTDTDHIDNPTVGRRYDMASSPMKRAFGRRSESDSPTAYSILQARQAIVRAERNTVAKSLLRLATAHPNDALWKVDRRDYKKVLDRNTGMVKEVRDLARHDNVLTAKIGGVAHEVTIYDPHIARAMTGAGEHPTPVVIRAAQKINGILAQSFTRYRPVFWPTHLFRTTEEAAFNLPSEKVPGLVRKVVSDIPNAIAGMNRMLNGKTDTKWAKYAHEFSGAGGKLGFLNLSNIEGEKKSLNRIMAELQPTKTMAAKMAVRDQFLTRIHHWTDAGENGVRLSTYVHLREAGWTKQKAAREAQEVAINFAKRGFSSAWSGAAYMFSNAATQGGVRFAQRLASSPRARKVALGVMAGFAAQAVLNRIIAGDDDDGKNRYDKIDDYTKQHFMIFMLPKGSSIPYIKIPIAYALGALHSTGTAVGDMISGSRSPAQAAHGAISGTLSAFSPLETLNLVHGLWPTLTQPFVDIYRNKDFFNRPIEPTSYSKTKPASQMANYNTSAPAKVVAQGLNSLSGGNASRAGAVDVSPTHLDYLWSFLAGGIQQTVNDFAKPVEKAASGQMPGATDLPFVKSVVGRDNYFANKDDYYSIVDSVQTVKDEMKANAAAHDTAAIQQNAKDYAREHAVMGLVESAQSQIRAISKTEHALDANTTLTPEDKQARIDALQAQKQKAMDNVRKAWNDFGKK